VSEKSPLFNERGFLNNLHTKNLNELKRMPEEKNIETIVLKYLKCESNPEELEKALELFSDPYHNLDLRPVLFRFWEKDENTKTNHLPQLKNPETILDKIHHRINIEAGRKKENHAKKLAMNLLKAAAILVVGLFIGILAQSLQKTEPVFYTAIAPKGSISQMILPDSTMVYLNAGSELKYTEENQKNIISRKGGIRKVFLAGEAWFDVSKNEKKPFVVHTPVYNVEVMGTQFNVKAYPDDNEVATTLEKGKVKITSSEKYTLQETATLQPGEQLIYTKNKGITICNVNTRRFTAWKDNKLIFINMNLKELFVLLERKYGVDIEVADNVILDYHYDSTITTETILEVLDLIAETLPIKYRIEGQKVIIQKR
jgi:ferric-dicitrate binding protein FerR (iron transport regulator)